MSEASKKIEQDYEKLTNDVLSLKQDVSALVSEFRTRASEATEQRKDSVTHALNRKLTEAQARADELSEKTKDNFEERPWLFLVGAFLLGILISAVMKRN